MKRFLVVTGILTILVTGAYGQAPKPTPPSDDDVVKISTTLIQIDVTVTDKKGNVVKDLKPSEIEIYENGEKQDISNFSFIENAKTVTERVEKKQPKDTVVLPPSTIRPESVKRTIALVVDDLTLSFESVALVRRALRKFVDEQMQEGDLVAIIRTGAGIGALQQFTNDRRQLYAAIEKLRWNSFGTGRMSTFGPLQPPGAQTKDTMGNEPDKRPEERAERESNEFRESIFAAGTLGAINYIVRGMRDLPGRKSIMLLSDGFPLFITNEDGFKEGGRVLDNLRSLVDMANRASVVIYSLDARGLVFTGISAEDDTNGMTTVQLEKEITDRRNYLMDSQDGLRYLAKQTGGLAIVNSNDLAGGIRRILDDQSYYLVGYIPDDETFDPRTRRFNKLEVKVNRRGLKVRYRSGFFGVSSEKIERPVLSNDQKLLRALTSPFAVNDISLRLNALFGATEKGPFIRSLVHIRAQDLTFTDEADGSKKAVLDILAVGFGDKGLPADQISKIYTISIKKEAFANIVKNGFVYDFVFPIKKPGAYQLRIAISDPGSGKVGSANQFVEVPDLKKDRMVMSGVLLENISLESWNKRQKMTPEELSALDENSAGDTSLRQFKRGSVLNYGLMVFNPKLDEAKKADLSLQIRVFRDGKPFFEGQVQKVPGDWQEDLQKVRVGATLNLGGRMEPGDYVLQIVVTDNLAKNEKRKVVSQFVQFEIVD
jgi:VWFA-related protein